MVRGRPRADPDTDRKYNLSLGSLLEVVGEFAGRVPKPEQTGTNNPMDGDHRVLSARPVGCLSLAIPPAPCQLNIFIPGDIIMKQGCGGNVASAGDSGSRAAIQ